jgi:hypothetical protein
MKCVKLLTCVVETDFARFLIAHAPDYDLPRLFLNKPATLMPEFIIYINHLVKKSGRSD